MTIELNFQPNVVETNLDISGVKIRVKKINDDKYQIWIEDEDNRFIHSKLPKEYEYISINNIALHDTHGNMWWCYGYYSLNNKNGYFNNGNEINYEQLQAILESIVNGVNKLEEIHSRPEIHRIGKITITATPVSSKKGYVMMKIEDMRFALELSCKKYMTNPPMMSYCSNMLYIINEPYIINTPCIHINGTEKYGPFDHIDLSKPMTKEAADKIIEWIKKCVDNYNILKHTEVIKVGNVTITKVPIPNDHNAGHTECVPFTNNVYLTIDGLINIMKYPSKIISSGNTAYRIGDPEFTCCDKYNTSIFVNDCCYFPLKNFKCSKKDADKIIQIITASEEKLANYYKENEKIQIGDTVEYLGHECKVIDIENNIACCKINIDNSITYRGLPIELLKKIEEE